MHSAAADGRRVFRSTDLAGRRAFRLAQAVALVSAVIFSACAPFATRPLAHLPAFIPASESALVICDLITAALLFSRFSLLPSRALFALASGYLFTAFIAVSHALTFPDAFAPTGLLGAGPQSTAWLHVFWLGGFPLFVIGYALLKDERGGAAVTSRAGTVILAGVAAVLAVVCGFTLAATANQDFLPALMLNTSSTPAMTAVVSGLGMLSVAALAVLYWRRPHTVLDLWLMVVMCAWLFDIALSAVLNASRYDLGWYAGRIYGLMAASALLIVLLIENGTQYARLAQLSEELSAANKALEKLSLQDGLTGLANRRFFDMYLDTQIAVARRHKRALALVLCDVDSFKAYNDHYGHQAGDECLKQVAAALRSCCRRPGEIAARYGGEEFAMILPDTELSGAARTAELAREAVSQLNIPHARSDAVPHVSISGGVAVLLRRIDMTAVQLITAADQTLYQAKHLGRNRMVSAQAEPGQTEPPVAVHRSPVTG